jgi:hypothetical protein
MLLGQSGQFDVRLRVPGAASSPLLEVLDGVIAPPLFHEQDGEGPLAGHVVRVPSQAEVVVLLRDLTIGGVPEDLGLLVVRRAEVVEAVRVSRLPRERLLEVVDRSEVVALLVELNPLGRVITAHPAAASRCNDDEQTEHAGADRHGANFRKRGGEGTQSPPPPQGRLTGREPLLQQAVSRR